MKHITTITSYCKTINIPIPKHPYFDIRKFEENMPFVKGEILPFKHEFYAIAIKTNGNGKAKTGAHSTFNSDSTVFFNTPFQIISWDNVSDWEGFYVMFSSEFISSSKYLQNIFLDFPYLRIDTSIPFKVSKSDLNSLLDIFILIYKEYNNLKHDSLILLESYLISLLHLVNRLFNAQVSQNEKNKAIRASDIKLLSRFQNLIETSFYDSNSFNKKLHSPSFYANLLLIHPNYLNAVVKQVSGKTAKVIINNHILSLSKARLIQTDLSIKEIAYSLNFDTANKFSSFFKKQTNLSPSEYKKIKNI